MLVVWCRKWFCWVQGVLYLQGELNSRDQTCKCFPIQCCPHFVQVFHHFQAKFQLGIIFDQKCKNNSFKLSPNVKYLGFPSFCGARAAPGGGVIFGVGLLGGLL